MSSEDEMVMVFLLILRSLCKSAPHWNLITAKIQLSVWPDNSVIRFMCYVLDLLIWAMKVVNCMFVSLYGLPACFSVPIYFGGLYLADDIKCNYRCTSCILLGYSSNSNFPFIWSVIWADHIARRNISPGFHPLISTSFTLLNIPLS